MENLSGPAVCVWGTICIWNEFPTKNTKVAAIVSVRGLVQSPCGKINIIITLTFYPLDPLPLS